ncbi:MarR family winged helix-turn-helix transcriptional regulator [Naumannella halotolerans]|uniref:MarR family winged helix-turn-helix transcriptional regulator n=1 Tax=Naumannella halotolerans TaxID=993414 RepID=UPI00370D5233
MSTDPDLADLPLGQLLMRAGRGWRHAQLRALEPFGLAAHQAHAFWVVVRWGADADELRLSRLADRLRIAPRSATEVVDALEDKGLVRRLPSQTDRRATVVELTDAGRELAVQMRQGQVVTDFFAGLSEQEAEQLRKLLIKVITEAGE